MASDIIRNMPCNVEAEQYVLGAIIFDNECIPDVMSTLKAEEFYLEQHRVIYNAMISVQNKAEPIDFVTLKSQLGINFDTIGGIEYLTKIRLMVSTTSNLKYHIKIIKDKAVLRKLIAAGSHIVIQTRKGIGGQGNQPAAAGDGIHHCRDKNHGKYNQIGIQSQFHKYRPPVPTYIITDYP